MPTVVRKGSYAPPFMRRRQMVQDTQPLATPPEPEETPVPAPAPQEEPERAREGDGTYKADDPKTAATDEAWTDGEGPAWNEKMLKSELLEIALEAGLDHLSDETHTKKQIIKELRKAGV